MNLISLAEIRQQFLEKEKCPKCGHQVTVEKTSVVESIICENCLDYVVVRHLNVCCANPEPQKVKLITSGLTVQVRTQCKNCGHVSGNSIGGVSQKDRDSLPAVDQVKREQWQDLHAEQMHFPYKKIQELKQIRFQKEREGNTEEWFKQYNAYLRSQAWYEKRQRVLKRDNHKCQCCLNNIATQVHHKTYEFVDFKGGEPCYNLISVCTDCHNKIHEK